MKMVRRTSREVETRRRLMGRIDGNTQSMTPANMEDGTKTTRPIVVCGSVLCDSVESDWCMVPLLIRID